MTEALGGGTNTAALHPQRTIWLFAIEGVVGAGLPYRWSRSVVSPVRP